MRKRQQIIQSMESLLRIVFVFLSSQMLCKSHTILQAHIYHIFAHRTHFIMQHITESSVAYEGLFFDGGESYPHFCSSYQTVPASMQSVYPPLPAEMSPQPAHFV